MMRKGKENIFQVSGPSPYTLALQTRSVKVPFEFFMICRYGFTGLYSLRYSTNLFFIEKFQVFKSNNTITISIHDAEPKFSSCAGPLVFFGQYKPNKFLIRHLLTLLCHCTRHNSVYCFHRNTKNSGDITAKSRECQ